MYISIFAWSYYPLYHVSWEPAYDVNVTGSAAVPPASYKVRSRETTFAEEGDEDLHWTEQDAERMVGRVLFVVLSQLLWILVFWLSDLIVKQNAEFLKLNGDVKIGSKDCTMLQAFCFYGLFILWKKLNVIHIGVGAHPSF